MAAPISSDGAGFPLEQAGVLKTGGTREESERQREGERGGIWRDGMGGVREDGAGGWWWVWGGSSPIKK